MKNDKNERTPYIMKTTKHFNDVRVPYFIPLHRLIHGKNPIHAFKDEAVCIDTCIYIHIDA